MPPAVPQGRIIRGSPSATSRNPDLPLAAFLRASSDFLLATHANRVRNFTMIGTFATIDTCAAHEDIKRKSQNPRHTQRDAE